MKCLQKEPRDRYQTAEALSQDLARFARGDPIEAKPLSNWELLVRRAAKHRIGILMVSSIAILALVSLLFISRWSEARQETARAQRKANEARYQPTVEAGLSRLRQVQMFLLDRCSHDLYLYPRGYTFFPFSPRAHEVTEVGRQPAFDAIAVYTEASRLCPERADAYWHRARAYVLVGDESLAKKDLNRVLELIPNNVPASWLSKSLRGKRIDFTDHQSAHALYGTWARAQGHAHLKEYKQAAQLFGDALHVLPDASEPYVGMRLELHLAQAVCLLRAEEYVRALQHLKVAQNSWPNANDAKLLEAMAFLALFDEFRPRAEEQLETLYQQSNCKTEIASIVAEGYFTLLTKRRVPEIDWEFVERWLDRLPDVLAHIARARFLAIDG